MVILTLVRRGTVFGGDFNDGERSTVFGGNFNVGERGTVFGVNFNNIFNDGERGTVFPFQTVSNLRRFLLSFSTRIHTVHSWFLLPSH